MIGTNVTEFCTCSVRIFQCLGIILVTICLDHSGLNCNRELLYLLNCHWDGNRNLCHIWHSSQRMSCWHR